MMSLVGSRVARTLHGRDDRLHPDLHRHRARTRPTDASAAVEIDPPGSLSLERGCGLSAPLSDGNVLWLFCETAVRPSTTVVADNTAAIAAPPTLTAPADVLIGGVPQQFLTALSDWDDRCNPAAADGRVVRPRSLATIPGSSDHVLIYFEHVCTSGGTPVSSGGVGVAEWVYDSALPPGAGVPLAATVLSDFLWHGEVPTSPGAPTATDAQRRSGFGQAAAFNATDGNVYVYRCSTAGSPAQGFQVGRTTSATVGDPSSYRWLQPNGQFATTVPEPGTGMEAPTAVDLLVDDVVVATDSDPLDGWQVTWDTAALTTGEYMVRGVAHDAVDGSVSSPTFSAWVQNDIPSLYRLKAGSDRGVVSDQEWPLEALKLLTNPSAAVPRHVGPVALAPSDSSTDAVVEIMATWGQLSPATQASIADYMTPTVIPQVAPTLSPDWVGCQSANVVTIDVFFDVKEYCTYASGGFKLHFTVADENGIPDGIGEAAGELIGAKHFYSNDLGYGFPDFDTSNPFDVFIGELPGASFANPFGVNPLVPQPGIFLDVDREPFLAEARHELFHVAQFHEAGFEPLANYVFPTLGSASTSWWLEATAEWATHAASVHLGGGERYEYASSLEDFLADPTEPLTSFERVWELGAGPLRVSTGLSARPYGAFLFAEFLEAHVGTQGIRTTWEKIGDGRSANEAIEEVLAEASQPVSIGEFVSGFWLAAYILSDVNDPPIRDFDDVDVGDWVASLGDGDGDLIETEGDGFDPRRRAGRFHPTVTVPNSGFTDWIDVQAGAGGAAIVDLQLEPGYGGELTALLAPESGSNWERYAAVLVAWEGTDPGGFSGFPKVCVRDGEPVMIASPLSSAVGWEETIDLDADCPTATLIVVNKAPSSSGVDDPGLRFHVDEEPLGVPGTTGTVTIGGPPVPGVVGATLGVVSSPPAAGSPTGWICVEVQVDRGTFFLFQPAVEIQVRNASTDAVVASVTWPNGTLNSDPKVFYLGPIDADPWAPHTVTVTVTNPNVDGWSARVYAHSGPPNACAST